MGRGIMQVAAQGGMRVLAFAEKPEAARRQWRMSQR
jgi:3-hydroxyacyl-CoA dehydrogenase